MKTRHHDAEELSKCMGELVLKQKIVFAGEPYEEYRCQKCGRWVYLPVNGSFRFETRVRI